MQEFERSRSPRRQLHPRVQPQESRRWRVLVIEAAAFQQHAHGHCGVVSGWTSCGGVPVGVSWPCSGVIASSGTSTEGASGHCGVVSGATCCGVAGVSWPCNGGATYGGSSIVTFVLRL